MLNELREAQAKFENGEIGKKEGVCGKFRSPIICRERNKSYLCAEMP